MTSGIGAQAAARIARLYAAEVAEDDGDEGEDNFEEAPTQQPGHAREASANLARLEAIAGGEGRDSSTLVNLELLRRIKEILELGVSRSAGNVHLPHAF